MYNWNRWQSKDIYIDELDSDRQNFQNGNRNNLSGNIHLKRKEEIRKNKKIFQCQTLYLFYSGSHFSFTLKNTQLKREKKSIGKKMVLIEKLWDDVMAGPQPDKGLGKLRKYISVQTTGTLSVFS